MSIHRTLLLAVVIFISGCGRTLMPTPTLYLVTGENPFDEVPQALRSNIVDVLYATDRAPTTDDPERPAYGAQRSMSLAFGTAKVQIGPDDLTWEELAEVSANGKRSKRYSLAFKSASERGRLPKSPWYQNLADDPMLTPVQVELMEAQAQSAFHELIKAQLALSDDKRVFVFVHGFNNTFPYAIESAAELWHMGGRKGALVAYTWPAARNGLLGYNADRESGEFTIGHLKSFLRMLAQCEEVEGIGVLAHSRGTDVLMTALRELHIEIEASGQTTAEVLKLESVILMAADIDLEVAGQRIMGERVADATNHLTIYTASDDRALAMARKLFDSKERLGEIGPSAVNPVGTAMLKHVADKLTIIYRPYRIGFLGHAYFLDDPRVSSDLILASRENRIPGAEHGRPLILDDSGLWIMPEDYLSKPPTIVEP